MPFDESVRTEALVRSGRFCCVCHTFAGRDAVVHHIVQASDGGPNILDNAIVLCSRCHGEAGHYNDRHPLGTKYRPDELRRHRDDWWSYRAKEYSTAARPVEFREPQGSGRGLPVQRRTVGILWSNRADISEMQEIVEIEASSLAKDRHEDQTRVTWYELLQRGENEFFVYQESNYRGDWAEAVMYGAPYFDEPGDPLTLVELQQRFPQLAAACGLSRIRRI